MNKYILSLLAALLFVTPSHALVRGVNRADKIIKIKRGDSLIQRCFVFKDFIVIEVDSHQKGAQRIAIRDLTKNTTPKKACSSPALSGEVVLDIGSEYVFGVRGDYLFTEGSDGFGKTNWINIYSKKSPKALKRLNYHSEKDFIITELKDTLALEFYMNLKLTCTLSSKDPSCWERTKKENKIPGDIVEKPKCEKVYEGDAFKTSPELKNNPQAIQVFTHVKMEDIKSKTIQFMKGEATCDASP